MSDKPVTYRNKNNEPKNTSPLPTEYNETKIKSLNELKPADHIVIVVDQTKYCHAILDSVNVEKNVLDIIFYDSEIHTAQSVIEPFQLDNSCRINASTCSVEFNKSSSDLTSNKSSIKKASISVDLTLVSIYIEDYAAENQETLPQNETLEKARSFVGSRKYNVFVNNDEHFATYCKTGKAAKLFILNPNDLTAKNILGKSVQAKIASTLAQETGQVILVNVAKHVATKFPRTVVSSALPVAAEAAGGLIGAGVEGVSMGYDIYKKKKDHKEGKLSDLKFKKYIAKRVTRGTMSVAGGIAGGIIGQVVIPVPVLGAVVGSIVGGIVGAGVGHGEGILIGEIIEVVETRQAKKKAAANVPVVVVDNDETATVVVTDYDEAAAVLAKVVAEQTAAATETSISSPTQTTTETSQTMPAQSSNLSKYQVLDKLVFKFKSDVLKDLRLAHVKTSEDQNVPETAQTSIILNGRNDISDEDYEIYLLNDTNETIEDLNIESLFDVNGQIDKRKSLEAFSSSCLPDDINVYFVDSNTLKQ